MIVIMDPGDIPTIRHVNRLVKQYGDKAVSYDDFLGLKIDPSSIDSKRITFLGHATTTTYGENNLSPEDFAQDLIDMEFEKPGTGLVIDLFGCQIGYFGNDESYAKKVFDQLFAAGYHDITINAFTDLVAEKRIVEQVLSAHSYDTKKYSVKIRGIEQSQLEKNEDLKQALVLKGQYEEQKKELEQQLDELFSDKRVYLLSITNNLTTIGEGLAEKPPREMHLPLIEPLLKMRLEGIDGLKDGEYDENEIREHITKRASDHHHDFEALKKTVDAINTTLMTMQDSRGDDIEKHLGIDMLIHHYDETTERISKLMHEYINRYGIIVAETNDIRFTLDHNHNYTLTKETRKDFDLPYPARQAIIILNNRMGQLEEEKHQLDLSYFAPQARFLQGANTKESKIKALKQLISNIRNHPDNLDSLINRALADNHFATARTKTILLKIRDNLPHQSDNQPQRPSKT